jgi:hypothetical protein
MFGKKRVGPCNAPVEFKSKWKAPVMSVDDLLQGYFIYNGKVGHNDWYARVPTAARIGVLHNVASDPTAAHAGICRSKIHIHRLRSME